MMKKVLVEIAAAGLTLSLSGSKIVKKESSLGNHWKRLLKRLVIGLIYKDLVSFILYRYRFKDALVSFDIEAAKIWV